MLRKLKYNVILLFVVFAIGSCSKSYFDINVDPNNPANLPPQNLLPQVVRNIGNASTIFNGMSDVFEVYVHRITVREAPNAYNVTGSTGYVETMWDPYYAAAITNLNIIIDKATAAGNFKYVGIAKVLKAFIFSQLVDVFGDVPYSEAGELLTGVLNPKFDDDVTIYPTLFTMIDEGIADLKNPAINPSSPGADDLFYGGSVTKWVKMANTLKLKLYTQERKVKNVTAEVTALLASPSTLISSTADNFQIAYTNDNRNPGYGDYGAAQRTKYISPWFYEIMMGYNQNILTDNKDPRIPYYWLNQMRKDDVTGHDGFKTEYRDGPFVSIYFGSNGPNSGFAQQNTQTGLGIYPVGGKYDDGSGSGYSSGSVLSASSSTGAAPYRLITYADRLYLEAELIQTGVVTGDARAKTLAAITESFKMVDDVVKRTGVPGVPAIAGTATASTYIGKVMDEYDANPDKHLQIIMTQKWISSFGSAIDAYTDYRRTGFPIIFDPNNPAMAPGHLVQPPLHGNPTVDPQPAVLVSASRGFPLSMPWPATELNSNSSAPTQKEPSTYKVFWQP